MRNEVLEAVTNELHAVNADYLVNHAGKHLHVRFKINGESKCQVIPKTASDWRAAKNARALMRRTLADLGVKNLPETPKIYKPKEKASPIIAPVALSDGDAARQINELKARCFNLEAVVEKLSADLEAVTQLLMERPVEKHVVKSAFVRPSLKRVVRQESLDTKRKPVLQSRHERNSVRTRL